MTNPKVFCFKLYELKKSDPGNYVKNLANIAECMYDHGIYIDEIPDKLADYEGDHHLWSGGSSCIPDLLQGFIYFGVDYDEETQLLNDPRFYKRGASAPDAVVILDPTVENVIKYITSNFERGRGI